MNRTFAMLFMVLVLMCASWVPPSPAFDPPLPYAIASFGTASMVTVTVHVDYDASRSDYTLYASQSTTSPSTTTSPLAFSRGHPTNGEFGSDLSFSTNQTLTIQLTYERLGNTITLTATVPSGSVVANSSYECALE